MSKTRVSESPPVSSAPFGAATPPTSDGAYFYADDRLLNDAAFLITHLQEAVAHIPSSVKPKPTFKSLTRIQLDAQTLMSLMRIPCQLAQLSPAVWCAAALPAYALLRRLTYLIATMEQWQGADSITRAVTSLRKIVLLSPHSPTIESYDKAEVSYLDTRDRFVIGEASRAHSIVHIMRSVRYQFPTGMQVADIVRAVVDDGGGGECQCESDMMMRKRFRHLLTPLQGLSATCFRLVHDDYLAMLTSASNTIELLGLACHACVSSIKSCLKALKKFTDEECDTQIATAEVDLSFMSPSRHWILPTTVTLGDVPVVTMPDDPSSCACCMRSANNFAARSAVISANAALPPSIISTHVEVAVADDDALHMIQPIDADQTFNRRSSRARVQRAVFTRALIESVLPSQKRKRQIDTAKSVLRTITTRSSAAKKGFG